MTKKRVAPQLREPLAGRVSAKGAKGWLIPSRRTAPTKKLRAERSGHRAETLAALYLQLKGYRILARRFKTPVGEIDLIVKRGKCIAFVEVKGRANRSTAAASIHGQNQARVVRAAQWWLQRHGQYIEHEVRFDVCLIAWYRWPHHIAHAFSAVA